MRVSLFKDSHASFLQALDDAGLQYEEIKPVPGQILASGTMVVIAQTAAIAGSIATVLVAWLKARSSRKIFITLEDNRSIQLEGYSIQQLEQLLPLVKQMSAIDTKPAEEFVDRGKLETMDE